MKVSARNVLGYGQKIVTGAVNTEVTLEIAPELSSLSRVLSADQLELAEGKEAYAVIKSSNVMIAVD